jgi:hypothetical protein
VSDTLGSLVDKLSVCNLKLWFSQEELQACAAAGKPVSAEVARRLVNLNRQRNLLMTEIDQTLDRAAKDGSAEIDHRPKL